MDNKITVSELGHLDVVVPTVEAAFEYVHSRAAVLVVSPFSEWKEEVHFGRLVQWRSARWYRGTLDQHRDRYAGIIVEVTNG